MMVTTTTRGPVQLIQPSGELDDESAERLATVIGERITRGGKIVIDLGATAHVNSAGLGALVNATAQANVQECRIILAQPSPQVAGVLEITKLTRFFEIAPSVEEALGRFGK
jgi:anti-sigma B factor antagonist